MWEASGLLSTAPRAGDLQAKVLAHTLKKKGRKLVTVWEGEKLVYQRPLTSADG